MAFSSSSKGVNIAGIKKIEVISFNAASVTSGTISSKISHIEAVIIQNETSGSVAGMKAVATGQNIAVSGLNSNDVGNVVVFGY